MSSPSTPLALRRYGPGDAALLLDTLADVWAEAHDGHDDVARASFTPERASLNSLVVFSRGRVGET